MLIHTHEMRASLWSASFFFLLNPGHRSLMLSLCYTGATMDLVLNAADYYFFTPYVYPATWPEDEPFRQIISLLLVTNLGALVLYFLFATLSYYFIFDHDLKKHPHFLEVSRIASSSPSHITTHEKNHASTLK